MSTRSRIAKQDPATGKVTMIYCHSDGYITHNGRILLEHYQDERKIDELLALGDISFLAPEIGRKHAFDIPHNFPGGYVAYMESPEGKLRESWVMAYGRDRGEKDTAAMTFSSLGVIDSELYEEYFYLRRDGKWLFSNHGTFTSLMELIPEMVQAEVRAEAARLAEYQAKRSKAVQS